MISIQGTGNGNVNYDLKPNGAVLYGFVEGIGLKPALDITFKIAGKTPITDADIQDNIQNNSGFEENYNIGQTLAIIPAISGAMSGGASQPSPAYSTSTGSTVVKPATASATSPIYFAEGGSGNDESENKEADVGKYQVGAYQDIKGVEGLDAHHAGQKSLMKNLVENYDPQTAPAINVPKVGHTISGPNGIVSRSIKGIDNARQLLARDIMELRRVYDDIPNSALNYYNLITSNFKKAVVGYFKAQFKIMVIITIILFVGLMIISADYALLLALLIAFLDLLPVFGTGTVIFPWVIINLINERYKEAVVLIVLYIICQTVKQLLQPKMVGDSIGLSPLMTLLFLFIGYRFGGLLGIIIGIPVGMIVVNLYRAGLFDTLIRGVKIIVKDVNEYRKF